MIDVFTETVFPLKDGPKQIPSRPHLATVIRWWQRGCRGVHLETVLIGGARHTSREAVQRFVDATTAAADGKPPADPSPQSRKRVEQAEKQLAARGI